KVVAPHELARVVGDPHRPAGGRGRARGARLPEPLDDPEQDALAAFGIDDGGRIHALLPGGVGDDLLVDVSEPQPLGDERADPLALGAYRPRDRDDLRHPSHLPWPRWAASSTASCASIR